MDKLLISKPITEKYYDIIKKNLLNKQFKLSIILVGEREDSNIYVNIKKKNV